jgi:ribonuclease BN (tRNA processing enzyme)
MPAKYRNVSGLFLDSKSKGGVLIDCGEGSFGQLCRLYGPDAAREKVRNLRCAWISHIHADHHVGLPTILIERRKAILNEKGNDASVPPLLVVGPAPLRRFLNAFSQVEPLDFEFVDCRNATREKWDAHQSRQNDDETNAQVGDAETFPLDPRLVSAAATPRFAPNRVRARRALRAVLRARARGGAARRLRRSRARVESRVLGRHAAVREL